MKINELTQILDTLHSYAPKGVGIFTISKETGIKPLSIREYLKKNKEYFVQLPDKESYQINRFGKFKGSIEEIIEDYKITIEESGKTQGFNLSSSNWWIYIVFIAVFFLLILDI